MSGANASPTGRSHQDMNGDFLISRHPVYDSKIGVAAYELRSPATTAIYSMFTESGLDQIVGEHQAVVSLTPEAFSAELWKPLPVSRVVLGCFEDIGPGDLLSRTVTTLVNQGYRVALSDALSAENLSVLGALAEMIKVDVTRYTPDDLEKRVADLRKFKTRLLAERVDTYDDLEFAKSLGFDFYEGIFLCKPAALKKDLPVSRLTMIRLLAKLQNTEVDMAELEKVISQDVALSYKLLRHANSAAVALSRSVNSVGHAVRLVGMETIRNWASALLLSTVDDKPRELMTMALVRASMCERLAASQKNAKRESFFAAGLLSVLDALLDCPMERALDELPLDKEIKIALVNHSGTIGQALRCTIAYERADWDEVQFYGLPLAPIRETYMNAIAWARQINSTLLVPA